MLGGRKDIGARPLQVAADRLLAATEEPALLVVEAPMGEGKTELAFLAYLRLQALHNHRGLYLALPTQATGAAIFERTLKFLEAFSSGTPLDLQLAQGNAALNEHVLRLRGIDGRQGQDVSSSMWFAQRRRALLSPYGVGTIDQALLAVLNVKHHFVRLWGLSNRVVILDEVHAYDAYTTGLIETLLKWLKLMGSSVVLMSATLPSAKRRRLLKAWGVEEEPDTSYPRLSLATGGRLGCASFAARDLPAVHITGVSEDLSQIAALALRLLQSEGCGAVIVNTVERAQQLYRMVRDRSNPKIPVILLHARFPLEQRDG